MTEQQFNYFEFKHIDGDNTSTHTITSMYVGDVIDQFVCFLLGCGYHNHSIYEHMSSISEQHFELEEKRNNELLKKFNLPKPDLDIGLD